MKRESKNNDYLFDAIIITIITLVVQNPQLVCTDFNGVIPVHGSWQDAGPCWRSQLPHKNRLLQTHTTSMKDGMLINHTLQTEANTRAGIWRTGFVHAWQVPEHHSHSPCLAGTEEQASAHLKWAELPSGDTQLCSWDDFRPHMFGRVNQAQAAQRKQPWSAVPSVKGKNKVGTSQSLVPLEERDKNHNYQTKED